MITVLTETGERTVEGDPSPQALWMSPAEFETTTGWTMKPEGLCRGDVCVPVQQDVRDAATDGARIDAAACWRHMGKPAVATESGDVWSLGESADDRNAALLGLEAPDFTLPDFTGTPRSLHDFRRKRVLLITWASW